MSGIAINPAIVPVFSSLLFPTAAIDVVAVHDKDLVQVFKNARPVKATVKPTVKLMEQPVETGVVITDHRVIMPLEIELSLQTRGNNFRDTYAEMWDLKEKSTLLSVSTQARTYENMVIMDMSHEETVDVYNSISISLKLRGVLFSKPQFGIRAKKAGNNDTVNRGQVSPSVPPPAKSTSAREGFDWTKKKLTGG